LQSSLHFFTEFSTGFATATVFVNMSTYPNHQGLPKDIVDVYNGFFEVYPRPASTRYSGENYLGQ
jgi:hypothetical protein